MSKAAEKADIEVVKVGSHFGSWCDLCGDYYSDLDRDTAILIATRGCFSCKPSHRKRVADAAVMELLEFEG